MAISVLARQNRWQKNPKVERKYKMFRKLFLGGLALMLVLGMSLQTAPAFAQTITPIRATLKSVSLEMTIPTGLQQIRVTGTLPSACYSLSVSTPQVVRGANSSKPYISVRVMGIPNPGVTCTQVLQKFTTLVSIDANKLNLAPGTYDVLFNPVNGRSRFKVAIIIRPRFEYEKAVILKAALLTSYPPRIQIKGTLSSDCYKLAPAVVTVKGSTITVLIRGVKPAGVICIQKLQPFTTSAVIDPASLHLAPGKYTALINPLNGQSKFKIVVTIR